MLRQRATKVPVGNIIVPTVFPDFRSANRRGRMRKFRQILNYPVVYTQTGV